MEPRKEPPITNQIITQSPEAILPDRPVSKKLDLTSIKGYTDQRKATKLKTMIEDCKTELAIALNIFDPHEISLNHSAVLFCCQIVEDIFCKPGQGAIKEEIVVDVCKQYFNNDPDLVSMVIDLVFKDLPQIKFCLNPMSHGKK